MRWLQKEFKRAKKENRRCKKLYPDWKDDKYNCGPLKYIWGITSDQTDATSWHDLTNLDIYYNRDTQKYLLGIDINLNFDSIEEIIIHLDALCEKFHSYINKKFDAKINPFDLNLYNDGKLFEGNSETELYYKFKIFTNGYKNL